VSCYKVPTILALNFSLSFTHNTWPYVPEWLWMTLHNIEGDISTNCWHLCPVTVIIMPSSHHGQGRDKTVLSCLVRVGGVNRMRQVNTVGDRKFRNCFVQSRNAVWTELCLVSTKLPICKRVRTADRTGQNCSVPNISRTTENSLDLSRILFTPPTSQAKTVLTFPCRWCSIYA